MGRLQIQHLAMLGSKAPAIQLGSDTVTASEHVRVLGVTFSSDLSLEKHISRRVHCSQLPLASSTSSTLSESHSTMDLRQPSYMLVTSRVDYCNAVYAGAPKTVTDKCNECSMLPPMWSVTHGSLIVWLPDVTPRWASLAGCARESYLQDGCHGVPLSSWSGTYLADHFTTSSDIASRLPLRSANRHQLIVPRGCRLNTYGRQAFSISGPTRCLTSSEIRRVVLTVLSSFLRQSCLQCLAEYSLY